MKKKVVIKGPIYSQSGYGKHCRLVYEAVKRNPDYDIYVIPTPWGATSWLFENDEWRQEVDRLVVKTSEYLASKQQVFFDIAYNVVIPNEFERLAVYTIGVTAGIETDKCDPSWITRINETVDKILVPSTFAKNVLQNSKCTVNDNFGREHEVTIQKPIEVAPFVVQKDLKEKEVDLSFVKTDFNFLSVAQFGPRKNLLQTIKAFFKAFNNDSTVGLILKISHKNNCIRDRMFSEKQLKTFREQNFPDAKCKLYLLHGYLTDAEMLGLMKNKKVKCLVSTTHGEGFGLPIFEAAQVGLPIISHDFGGQADFLYYLDEKGKKEAGYSRVDWDLNNVSKDACAPQIISPDMKWAYPREISIVNKMQEIKKDHGRFVSRAKKLQKYVVDNFNKDKLDIYIDKKQVNKEEFNGISFCIPTNGKRVEKTLKTIQSIKNNMKNDPYEIILCGAIDNFKNVLLDKVILLDKTEEANNKKVASLRNEAAKLSKYNFICWADDDIVLAEDWLEKFKNYNSNNGWEVLSNKILNPDGTRHWDRAYLSPHFLVDYETPEMNAMLYQTSGFMLMKKKIFNSIKWPDKALVHSDEPEDVVFSNILKMNRVGLYFNKEATVWHNDEEYTTLNNQTLRKSYILQNIPTYKFMENSLKFTKIIEKDESK